ncbi:MAG: rane protein of unknown function [Candidatus Saccharibacteria bacterium]|nr:rane protein of unknown function [Candidatus Saccharibacteria bacterium]
MSFFVKSTPASVPKTKNIRPISLGLAAVLVIMVVAQLFTFETFPKVIADMLLPGGSDVSSIRAALIVTLEVAALPFLLSMRLSPAMRVVSMVAGWFAITAWFVASLWVNLSPNMGMNSGLLGDTISVPVGWWSVLFCLSLGVLAAWSAWGMWPCLRKKHKN